ncbi:MAG: hypothetical protein HY271_14125 [Deltaproteobacteria bacterium]|nr:hypothetical protein [Deltaproteobacteria bacterium]
MITMPQTPETMVAGTIVIKKKWRKRMRLGPSSAKPAAIASVSTTSCA